MEKLHLTAMNRQTKEVSLIFCLLMDAIGYATYAVPFFGELGDIFWAPVSALIFWRTFGSWRGALGGMFNFFEELMPGLDFIPSFTIMWFLQRSKRPVNYPITNR
jgi:hypothetical protein